MRSVVENGNEVVTVDLTTLRATPTEVAAVSWSVGHYMSATIFSLDGTCQMQLDSSDLSPVLTSDHAMSGPVQRFSSVKIQNTAQPGKTLVLWLGKAVG